MFTAMATSTTRQSVRTAVRRSIPLELPKGMKLDRSSFEVLLRYVLVDVVTA